MKFRFSSLYPHYFFIFSLSSRKLIPLNFPENPLVVRINTCKILKVLIFSKISALKIQFWSSRKINLQISAIKVHTSDVISLDCSFLSRSHQHQCRRRHQTTDQFSIKEVLFKIQKHFIEYTSILWISLRFK